MLEDINERVFLLAIYKKESDESLKDVAMKMEESRVFSLKDGKKYLKEFKKLGLIVDNELSMVGIEKAKEVELEFKL